MDRTRRQPSEVLEKHGILQSFSRVGKPGDNPWSESFFANLKKEAVHWRPFKLGQKPGKRFSHI
jgi:transposase InsO family protein